MNNKGSCGKRQFTKGLLGSLYVSIVTNTNSPSCSLLKWIGNKFKFAHSIVGIFPPTITPISNRLWVRAPSWRQWPHTKGLHPIVLLPLMEIWMLLKKNPDKLTGYYKEVIPKFKQKQRKRCILKSEINLMRGQTDSTS